METHGPNNWTQCGMLLNIQYAHGFNYKIIWVNDIISLTESCGHLGMISLINHDNSCIVLASRLRRFRLTIAFETLVDHAEGTCIPRWVFLGSHDQMTYKNHIGAPYPNRGVNLPWLYRQLSSHSWESMNQWYDWPLWRCWWTHLSSNQSPVFERISPLSLLRNKNVYSLSSRGFCPYSWYSCSLRL